MRKVTPAYIRKFAESSNPTYSEMLRWADALEEANRKRGRKKMLKKLERANERIIELERLVEQTEKQLKKDLSEVESQRDKLQVELDDFKQQLGDSNKKLRKLEADIDSLLEERDVAREKCKELQDKIDEDNEYREDMIQWGRDVADALVAFTDRLKYSPRELYPITASMIRAPFLEGGLYVSGAYMSVREKDDSVPSHKKLPITFDLDEEEPEWDITEIQVKPKKSKKLKLKQAINSQGKPSKTRSSSVRNGKPRG